MKDYNNKHKRVIPRDFFNESKLLKCLGKYMGSEYYIFNEEGNFMPSILTDFFNGKNKLMILP